MPVSFRPQALVTMLGLVLLLAVLAVSAGRGPTSPPARPSDTYVEAMVGAPRLVNPLLASSDTDLDLSYLVFSGLTRVDSRGRLAPDLASGWAASPDSRVFTFTLKPNLKWQDGEELTSDDVVFTLDLLRDASFPGDPGLAAPWKSVTAAAPERDTLVFSLAQPDASFPQYTTLGLLPRHLWSNVKVADMAGSALNLAPVGSGSWRCASAGGVGATPGGESGSVSETPSPSDDQATRGVLLEPNPYNPPAGAKVGRIWFRPYPAFGAALAGLQLGEVHGLGHIPADRVAEVQSVPGVTIHRQTMASYDMLLLNVRSPLLDRPETRQAIEYAIDRAALVRQVAGGQAVALESPVLPHSWAYDPQVKPRGYDPARARGLLDGAGWTLGPGGIRARAGVTLTLVLAANVGSTTDVAVARQVAVYLHDVGIDAELALVDRDRLLNDYLAPHAFHILVAGWAAAGVDPDLYRYWHSSQIDTPDGLNYAGWSNPVADKALQDARLTPNGAARATSFAAFQQAFLQDTPAVILYSPLYSYATRAPASGVSLPATDLLSPAQRFETVSGWSLQPAQTP